MLNQALAGRKEYHDRTCADMVRGRFPAPWHNLNINDMGDNILRKAAEELKKPVAGFSHGRMILIIEVGVRVII